MSTRESRPGAKSERLTLGVTLERNTHNLTGLIGHTSEYPLVDVVEILPPIPKRAARRVVVLCPFCRKRHTHGWPEDDELRPFLPRLSHCVGEYRAKAYRIVLPPDDSIYSGDLAAMRRRREASQRLPRLQSGRRDPLFGGGR